MTQLPAAWKTYLMGVSVIIHQVLKLVGVDVPDELMSASIDGILGIAAIYFRWRGVVTAKAAVENALYTPVPTGGK